MRFALNHITAPKVALADFFAMARALGVAEVEIRNDLPDVVGSAEPEAVKAAAEAAGMSKPSSGQIQYIDLSGADSVEVYAAGGGAALHQLTGKVAELWSYVLEYFR